MLEQLRPDYEAYALISQALRELEQAENARPQLGPRAQIAKQTADTLLDWRLPMHVTVAALVTPLLENTLISVDALTTQYGPAASHLGERFVAWHRANGASDEVGPLAYERQYSTQLRELFRLAYLDLPSLNFLLLLIADHKARLTQPLESISKHLAAQTEAIFVPLAEMLGMWSLRRRWLDCILHVLYPDKYDETIKLLGEIIITKDQLRDILQKHNQIIQSNTRSHDDRRWIAERKRLIEKAEAYFHIEKILLERFRKDFRVCPRLQKIFFSPGTSYFRARGGEPIEELASRLAVRILCHTESDCYRALGIVHSLGAPIAPRFSERFNDNIALPQPNGYRSLHTAIIYQGYKEKGGGSILVDIRILTPEMYRLNEMGVVAAQHCRHTLTGEVRAWWTRLRQLSSELRRLTRDHPDFDPALGIQDWLQRFDLGSRSDPLYVFTPRGEIILLQQGSTALDFAYHIHTNLGHHAAAIWVNEQLVPYNYPLQNGDLVRVDYNSYLLGPDLSWSGFVSASSSKVKIRRGLATRARSIHAGRAQIEEVLLKFLHYYEKDKHYNLIITTGRLDAFLYQIARSRGLPDLHALYAQVEQKRIGPDTLVRRLIAQEFAAGLVNMWDEPLTYPLHRIFFCDRCRPVPGEPIVGLEKRVGVAAKGLTVHRLGNAGCPVLQQAQQRIPLRWVERANVTRKELLIFQLHGEDRFGLLKDVLEMVYREPKTYLYNVQAQTRSDGRADITLTVEGDTLARLGEIQAGLKSLRSIRQVLVFPPSPAQRLALTSPPPRLPSNPYTLQEVYGRYMFFDREGPIAEILRWLKEPPPTRWLIMHGQRRVGKTSLAKHLEHEILQQQRLALPVFVDLQQLSRYGKENLARLFVSAVYHSLQKPSPRKLDTEESMSWLNRALEAAVKELSGFRLLIIVDELNMLLDLEAHRASTISVFSNLRAVMSARRDLNWLLIVQDAEYSDPTCWKNAGSLFEQAVHLLIPHLDPEWARRLIEDPVSQCEMKYENAERKAQPSDEDDPNRSIPARILELSAGNPYLIQLLCFHLVDRVRRQNRTNITHADLIQVVELIRNDGFRHFDHFTGPLKGQIGMIILAAVASASRIGEWIDIMRIIDLVQQKSPRLHAKALFNSITILERQGALAIQREGSESRVCIPITLFHDWLKQYIDLDVVIQEWQTSRRTRGA
jgi:GTP diphosphokinase / guanosine-3',5'-bis(diphosphate) 3'-diphosphatase